MARIVRAGDFVGPGERVTAERLERDTPADWVVICNRELVRPQSVKEVDFIVVGSHAIFVLEEKHWWGPIHGNDNGWVLSSGESFPSPIRSAEDLCRRLAGYLRDAIPQVKDFKGKFVYAGVVLSHEEGRLYVDDPRVASQVHYLDDCGRELVTADSQQPEAISISPFRQAIIDRLTELPTRPPVPSRIGSYTITEQLPSPDGLRTFRAVHDDGSERILRIAERSGTLDDAQEALSREAMLREYQALRTLAMSQRAPQTDPYFTWDQDQFWVIPMHVIGGKSLRAGRMIQAPQEQDIWPVLIDALLGLQEIHDAGVLHRAISPDRIWVGHDGRVKFSDFVIARLEGLASVAGADMVDPGSEYRAPECRSSLSDATPASDVYSLCRCLLEWVAGDDVETDSRELKGRRPDLSPALLEGLGLILDGCAVNADSRPGASAIASGLAALHKRPSGSEGGMDEMWQPGAVIESQYKVRRILGAGATATTYLVDDTMLQEPRVLKVIRTPELRARLAAVEFRMLRELRHPNLPEVFDVRAPASPFHLKLEYVPGSSVRDGGERFRGDRDLCLRIGADVLSALAYLASRNCIHRDVAPGNVLVPDETAEPVKLIDFGLATLSNQTVSKVGTPRYRAPEIDHGAQWTPQCDLYSLGVLLFETLYDRLPYVMDRDTPRKQDLLPPTSIEIELFGDGIARVLARAVSPDPGARYRSADEFARALATSASERAPVAPGANVVNPVVDDLRRTYRNSAIGNSDNRGLDTDFARATYVETDLDLELAPRVLAGEFSFLALAGNPGDGKTAFLQRLLDQIEAAGGNITERDPAHWRAEYKGTTFAALYDASKSHEQLGADAMLDAILDPLGGGAPEARDQCVLIAVNDGRLVDYFERRGNLHFAWLWDRLRPQIFEASAPRDGVALIDLKTRALTQVEFSDQSLFSRILDPLVDQGYWAACEGCAARLACPIRANALTFDDRTLSVAARTGLHYLLLAVHLERVRRPTIRDLRSSLAFLITGDLGCEDVHGLRKDPAWVAKLSDFLYYNLAFTGVGSPDLLLDSWRRLDPATASSPDLDSFLFFHRAADQSASAESIFLAASARPPLPLPLVGGTKQFVRELKRRYYFEGQAALDGDERDQAAKTQVLLPYMYFAEFRKLTEDRLGPSALLDILKGLSHLDGVPLGLGIGGLGLTVTPPAPGDVRVIKFVPADEFRLDIKSVSSGVIRATNDSVRLEHRTGASLVLTLDLFELVMRAAGGLTAGAEEHRPLVEDVQIFKNQLLSSSSSDVAIVDRGGAIHWMRSAEGRVVRMGATT